MRTFQDLATGGRGPRWSALLAPLCWALSIVWVQVAAAPTLQATHGWLAVKNASEFLTAMSTSSTQNIQLRQHLSANEVAAAMLARSGSTDLSVFAPLPSSLESIIVRSSLISESMMVFSVMDAMLLYRLEHL
jgi:hypothetical protein